ncbi:MAG: capsular polysaccharide biosynthesis protein [Pontibacterium sp.]
MIGYFSSGIEKIPYLEQFLEQPCYKLRPVLNSRSVTAIAGWGLKHTSVKARAYAGRKKLSYVSLEDGFLRSLGLGVNGALQHSLIVDYSGIYYDATRTSDLEQLILEADFSLSDLKRAESGIAMMKRYRLSKYNNAQDSVICLSAGDKPAVLVVDQTFGDASIEYGLASAAHFRLMLESAVNDNPGASVFIKTHPDVIVGKKKGYLFDMARPLGCTLITEDVSPWALLDQVEKVYVVTSQLGFEALLAGKQVYCFGLPFYAGWGLTTDYQSISRRSVTRNLTQIFVAAYLRYCRYINPYTGVRCEFEDTVTLLADQKRQRARYNGTWQAVGFSGWKQDFIASFLGREAELSFVPSVNRFANVKSDQYKILIWSSDQTVFESLNARRDECPLWFMEDGFIRSVGLGADLIAPLSLVIDSSGIYYDPARESDLERMLQFDDFSADDLRRAHLLRARLVQLKLSKYNVGSDISVDLPAGKCIILVPGQVEGDASIRRGAPVFKSDNELLRIVRDRNPDAYIIYKPHPDVLAGARKGVFLPEYDTCYDLLLKDIAMPELLERVDEVHTLTSLTGFEALLRGLKVFTYGLPFYAGWGLTNDYLTCDRRTRKLTLEQLVAATLIQYPVYVDPVSKDQISVETAVAILFNQRQRPPGLSVKSRIWRCIRKPV